MRKDKVLFVCVHSSARSQMAEALLKKMAGTASRRKAPDWNRSN
jgi:protein-tyrosine-phosphatase